MDVPSQKYLMFMDPVCSPSSQSLLNMQASKLPPALDRAWEAVGGGPSDLFFPEEFMGIWSVESTLASVQLPLGPDFVPDPKVSCPCHLNVFGTLPSQCGDFARALTCQR